MRLGVLAVEACGVRSLGAAAVAVFLRREAGASLRVLELSDNHIGEAGATMLAESLRGGHRLGRLGLNNAGIGDGSALAFRDLLQSNRSLHTLSLQRNLGITDVGAASLLGAVYDTRSIHTIVGSNHVVRNLDLRGCCCVSANTLKLISKLCVHGRILCRKEDVIRRKVSKHVADAGCGMTLENFGAELTPHVLAFVGKFNGTTSLFHTLKSMPHLYTRLDPWAARGYSNSNTHEKAADCAFLEEFRPPPRRARKIYAAFAALVPKRSTLVRYSDRRERNKHEPSDSASNNSQHYLSSHNVDTSLAQLHDHFTLRM
jgi:hypothetical protein